MTTFTIDSENNIVAHAGMPAIADDRQSFSTEKELAKLAAEWPSSRLIEVWNSFAGVTPFDELKPVKKFTNRQAGVRRIWEAVARLGAIVAAESSAAKERRSNPKSRASTGNTAKPEPNNKKAEVIAMMRRPKGATLSAIMEATGWQKHTVRGFVSILGGKGGQKIESSKNSAGERSYRIAR